jgi:hypothetical protein
MIDKSYNIIFYLPYKLYIEHEVKNNIARKCSYSIYTKKITDNLYLITIKVKDYSIYKQFENLFSNKELLPPWIAFPNMFDGYPRWNQGYEEDYCCKNWLPYWESLSAAEKIDYCNKHNAPQEWLDWLTVYAEKI